MFHIFKLFYLCYILNCTFLIINIIQGIYNVLQQFYIMFISEWFKNLDASIIVSSREFLGAVVYSIIPNYPNTPVFMITSSQYFGLRKCKYKFPVLWFEKM